MSRRELREHVFRMLFRKEFYESEAEFSEQVKRYLEELEPLEEKDESYMSGKVEDIYGHVKELDDRINEVAKGWKTRRMGKVDLTVLRLALYEMLYEESVPEKVAINEAVEIARKYGGDDSPSFVNGILAKLVTES
ncbi:MAG: transcription antitermination factor NusB [Subdoligranulum variabile]|uniref:Transcription antitermination protein NusB n=1 Tax=Qiania dongpingensis TaxID=2763669 RepID=A0A7G9G577_9FIRM|nr:transcription antitermination factor NusB [Qiania dongpingensis]PWM60718.1 MAG: transcription antitermination factor NusB [Subdoligranulum variabile]QNM05959.1 transcription antitermination factor NusB [Qiania dongpingensis]